MKRYKINRAYPVNTRASKNGVKWEYGGKKHWKMHRKKKSGSKAQLKGAGRTEPQGIV